MVISLSDMLRPHVAFERSLEFGIAMAVERVELERAAQRQKDVRIGVSQIRIKGRPEVARFSNNIACPSSLLKFSLSSTQLVTYSQWPLPRLSPNCQLRLAPSLAS